MERDALPDGISGGQLVLALGGAFLPLRWLDAIATKLLLPVPPGAGIVNKVGTAVFTDIAKDRPPVVDIGLHKIAKEGKGE